MSANQQPDTSINAFIDEWNFAVNQSSPTAATAVVIQAWKATSTSDATFTRLSELAKRFATRLTVTGVASLSDVTVEDCENFVWAPTRRGVAPSRHTVHLRRTAVRALYREAQQFDPDLADPSVTLRLPPKPGNNTRPLTDRELILVRTAALARPRQPLRAAATVAFAEATATTSEVPPITIADINLHTKTVTLPGADPVQPRTGTLTDWGVGVLTRYLTTIICNPDDLVFARINNSPNSHVAQAAMSNLLARLLHEAGIHDPLTKPASIRLWGGRQQLHHGIEAATRSLGLDSLDRAANALGHHWQVQP